jgi:hypothetical protein
LVLQTSARWVFDFLIATGYLNNFKIEELPGFMKEAAKT